MQCKFLEVVFRNTIKIMCAVAASPQNLLRNSCAQILALELTANFNSEISASISSIK